MPTELPPQMQHPIQPTENCGQQKMKEFIDHLFGDDEVPVQLPQMHGLAPEVPVQMHDIPLDTADLQQDAAPGPFSSGFYSEEQLVSKFQSLMFANNRGLTDMIKSELLQSFRMAPVNTPCYTRTPMEQSQKQDDNAAADSYFNFDNDVYHVSINPENLTEEANEDPEMIKLRRSERLVKPAKSLLSPFVVYRNIKLKQKKIANDEDNLIKTIKNWAPTSGVRELTLTAGGSVGPNFWAALLGTDGTGWLNDDHLF
ncbi:hypothetical protein HanHA89_Chr06g0215151 [Helianthus annuus]|nr:hypothetical protein HanHA89_Chr06g0215151 [Helianthus annuus]